MGAHPYFWKHPVGLRNMVESSEHLPTISSVSLRSILNELSDPTNLWKIEGGGRDRRPTVLWQHIEEEWCVAIQSRVLKRIEEKWFTVSSLGFGWFLLCKLSKSEMKEKTYFAVATSPFAWFVLTSATWVVSRSRKSSCCLIESFAVRFGLSTVSGFNFLRSTYCAPTTAQVRAKLVEEWPVVQTDLDLLCQLQRWWFDSLQRFWRIVSRAVSIWWNQDGCSCQGD